MKSTQLEAGYEPLPTDDPLSDYPFMMTPRQVAEAGIKPITTLMSDRYEGKGIPFVKIGRAVRYRKDDVLAYLDAHRFTSTREARLAGVNR